jgi:hypothetical protein
MSLTLEKPLKVGNEITVRISLTFQEAPDVHTLLAMTPVRERGKLIRLALERYIEETAHPAGDIEQQISAVSAWLRSRGAGSTMQIGIAQPSVPKLTQDVKPLPKGETVQIVTPVTSERSEDPSPSISRWLQT